MKEEFCDISSACANTFRVFHSRSPTLFRALPISFLFCFHAASTVHFLPFEGILPIAPRLDCQRSRQCTLSPPATLRNHVLSYHNPPIPAAGPMAKRTALPAAPFRRRGRTRRRKQPLCPAPPVQNALEPYSNRRADRQEESAPFPGRNPRPKPSRVSQALRSAEIQDLAGAHNRNS